MNYHDNHDNHDNHDQNTPIWDDKTAEWYAAEFGDHISNALTIKNAKLKQDEHWLEIGCGSGSACREAAKIITEGTIIGMDPTPAMIRIATENTPSSIVQLEYLLGAAENIPIENDSKTICIAINSLHHWNDYKKGLAEILRVLKPRGRLIISDEIVSGDSCGHSEGPLSKPTLVIEEIKRAGLVNVKLERFEEDGDGIYLFRAEKS